jgi:hypothetical protein
MVEAVTTLPDVLAKFIDPALRSIVRGPASVRLRSGPLVFAERLVFTPAVPMEFAEVKPSVMAPGTSAEVASIVNACGDQPTAAGLPEVTLPWISTAPPLVV